MSFNSALFLAFFPLVTFIYFVTPHAYRWLILLIASFYFYMCFVPAYALILVAMITIDYFAGLGIEKYVGVKRKLVLALSILGNLGMLIIFKYFNFFSGTIGNIASWLSLPYPGISLSLLLPIGLSFHTLQSLGYTIDVYKGKQKAERHPGIFALYVMFYPQLVAGPIERAEHMLHQFHEEHKFDFQKLNSGLRLMLWGFFMKVVIADRLAFFVNEVYDNPAVFIGPSFVIATVFFAFQIYCDFAGYSLIAIGAARTMGFDLMQNFNRPYIARSISDFWQRWHISLSSWLRDFVYIPLGGNRVEKWKVTRNVFITFLLSGLWHGAGWTYVIWGGLNGLYIFLSGYTEAWRARLASRIGWGQQSFFRRAWQIIFTFSVVCFAWIFFRANRLNDAKYIASHLLTGWDLLSKSGSNQRFIGQYILLNQRGFEFLIAIIGIAFLLFAEWWQKRQTLRKLPILSPRLMPFGIILLLITIVLFGEFRAQTFIYFQF